MLPPLWGGSIGSRGSTQFGRWRTSGQVLHPCREAPSQGERPRPSLGAGNGAHPVPLLAVGSGVRGSARGGFSPGATEGTSQPRGPPLWRRVPGYSSRSSRLGYGKRPGGRAVVLAGGRYRT